MKYRKGQLEWIESAGGPLILLSVKLLTAWSGDDHYLLEPEATHVGRATDYDRACAMNDYLGVLSVDEGQGLVLGDEPMATTWWPGEEMGGMLVRWFCGDNMAGIVKYFTLIKEEVWEPTGIIFEVGGHPLHLFDSVWPGNKAREYLTIMLDEGKYAIDTGVLHFHESTKLIFHRLRHIE